jgi:hypothetical protein
MTILLLIPNRTRKIMATNSWGTYPYLFGSSMSTSDRNARAGKPLGVAQWSEAGALASGNERHVQARCKEAVGVEDRNNSSS